METEDIAPGTLWVGAVMVRCLPARRLQSPFSRLPS